MPRPGAVFVASAPPLDTSIADGLSRLAEHGGRNRAHPAGGSLRSDLLQIAFLPGYPDDEELQVASAVIYE